MAVVKATGIKEIDAVLKALPDQVADKVLQSANASAARFLVDKAKLTAPEGPTGHLVDSIGVVKGSFNQVSSLQRGIGSVTVGPRRGGRYKGWAAHLVEYGTRARHTTGKGKKRKVVNANRGVMKATHFMEKAFNSTKDLVLGSINEQIGKKILALMRKNLK